MRWCALFVCVVAAACCSRPADAWTLGSTASVPSWVWTAGGVERTGLVCLLQDALGAEAPRWSLFRVGGSPVPRACAVAHPRGMWAPDATDANIPHVECWPYVSVGGAAELLDTAEGARTAVAPCMVPGASYDLATGSIAAVCPNGVCASAAWPTAMRIPPLALAAATGRPAGKLCVYNGPSTDVKWALVGADPSGAHYEAACTPPPPPTTNSTTNPIVLSGSAAGVCWGYSGVTAGAFVWDGDVGRSAGVTQRSCEAPIAGASLHTVDGVHVAVWAASEEDGGTARDRPPAPLASYWTRAALAGGLAGHAVKAVCRWASAWNAEAAIWTAVEAGDGAWPLGTSALGRAVDATPSHAWWCWDVDMDTPAGDWLTRRAVLTSVRGPAADPYLDTHYVIPAGWDVSPARDTGVWTTDGDAPRLPLGDPDFTLRPPSAVVAAGAALVSDAHVCVIRRPNALHRWWTVLVPYTGALWAYPDALCAQRSDALANEADCWPVLGDGSINWALVVPVRAVVPHCAAPAEGWVALAGVPGACGERAWCAGIYPRGDLQAWFGHTVLRDWASFYYSHDVAAAVLAPHCSTHWPRVAWWCAELADRRARYCYASVGDTTPRAVPPGSAKLYYKRNAAASSREWLERVVPPPEGYRIIGEQPAPVASYVSWGVLSGGGETYYGNAASGLTKVPTVFYGPPIASCPPGTVCFGRGGLVATPCPAGSYCPGGPMPAFPCPQGTYAPNPGAAECLICESNMLTACNADLVSVGGVDTCVAPAILVETGQKCMTGTVTPVECSELKGAADGVLNCAGAYDGIATEQPWCASGTYVTAARPAVGEFAGSVICGPCPVGYACPTVNTRRACRCDRPSGFPECAPSAGATYVVTALGDGCEACPGGARCDGGVAVPCPAGTVRAPWGRVWTSSSSTAAHAAPDGETPDAAGRWCAPTPAGHWSGAAAATPTACPAGTQRPRPGGTAAEACTACGGTGPRSVYWCAAGTGTRLQRCAVGQQANAARDGCVPVVAGWLHDARGFRACPLGFECAGTGADAVATACALGTHAPARGAVACTIPSAGTWAPSAALAATEQCPVGIACSGLVPPVACVAGMTTNADRTACAPCPLGSYCLYDPETGLAPHAPAPCPAGTYGTATGATGAAGCTPCPAGRICPRPGGITAIPVSSGNYSLARWTASARCPVGYSCGYGVLDACPPGKYTLTSGAKTCTDCPVGHWCPGTAVIAEARAIAALYVAGSNATAAPVDERGARPCPGGYDLREGPATGLQAEGPDTPGRGACPNIVCPADSSCAPGVYYPELCSNGTYGGAAACTKCARGTWCAAGLQAGTCGDGDLWLIPGAKTPDAACAPCPEGLVCEGGTVVLCAINSPDDAAECDPGCGAGDRCTQLWAPARQTVTGVDETECGAAPHDAWVWDATSDPPVCTVRVTASRADRARGWINPWHWRAEGLWHAAAAWDGVRAQAFDGVLWVVGSWSFGYDALELACGGAGGGTYHPRTYPTGAPGGDWGYADVCAFAGGNASWPVAPSTPAFDLVVLRVRSGLWTPRARVWQCAAECDTPCAAGFLWHEGECHACPDCGPAGRCVHDAETGAPVCECAAVGVRSGHDDCSTCAEGYAPHVGDCVPCPFRCAGRGACVWRAGAATCVCDGSQTRTTLTCPSYVGAYVGWPEMRTNLSIASYDHVRCPRACAGRAACALAHAYPYDRATATRSYVGTAECVCEATPQALLGQAWTGPGCTACPLGSVMTSPGVCSRCPGGCSGGECVVDPTDGSPSCVCPTGRAGADCSVCDSMFTGVACDVPCPGCSVAHGTCVTYGVRPVCLCARGWAGPRCDIPYALASEDACGVSQARRLPIAQPADACTDPGTATRAHGGACICAPGWSGATCAVSLTACTHATCNARGACVAGGGCDCAPPWVGGACEALTSNTTAAYGAFFGDGTCDGAHMAIAARGGWPVCGCEAGWGPERHDAEALHVRDPCSVWDPEFYSGA